MDKKIKDIRDALKNGTYYCALALALTLPDICSQVENGLKNGDNSNRTMYINWVNKYMQYDDFHFPVEGFEIQTFTGEMCYSLRCKVLHNGNTEVQNKKLDVKVDDFCLTMPNEENYYHGYRYIENSEGKKITIIGIDYICERICDTAEKFYNDWSNKEDFDQYSFQQTKIGGREVILLYRRQYFSVNRVACLSRQEKQAKIKMPILSGPQDRRCP